MRDTNDACELRCGDWRETLADVEVDHVITDPPYSARTHDGLQGENTSERVLRDRSGTKRPYTRAAVTYAHWTEEDVRAFVLAWTARARGWIVMITDHILAPVIEAASREAGRYVFQPLPFVEMGKQPRLSGDGPASWTCWIVVSRPRERRFQSWGSLPGAYVPPSSAHGTQNSERYIKGGKTEWLMRALVRDYSRPGDLICDPCAGGGTTLIAARAEGRRAIGSELDPATYQLAKRRIERPYTPDMFASRVANDNASQLALDVTADASLTSTHDR